MDQATADQANLMRMHRLLMAAWRVSQDELREDLRDGTIEATIIVAMGRVQDQINTLKESTA